MRNVPLAFMSLAAGLIMSFLWGTLLTWTKGQVEQPTTVGRKSAYHYAASTLPL
jgi:hypothetical protein